MALGLAAGALGWVESRSAGPALGRAIGALIPAIAHHAASDLIELHGIHAGRVFYQNFYQERPPGHHPANCWIVCVAGGS